MPNLVIGTDPTAEQVMNLARAIVNDMLRDTKGQNFTDSRPFTVEYLNAAIEEVQEYLAVNGISTQAVDNWIIPGIPPVPTPDPSIQVYVGKNGYSNGTTIVATPALPLDCLLPLKLWERQTGANQQFREMGEPQDGLPSRQQGPYMDLWEWRQSRIYMVGATSTIDLRMKYEQALLDLAAGSDFTQAIIPIPGGKRALAFAAAEYYSGPRQDPVGKGLAWLQVRKREALETLVTRYARKDQRIAFRPAGFRDRRNNIDGSLGGSYR